MWGGRQRERCRSLRALRPRSPSRSRPAICWGGEYRSHSQLNTSSLTPSACWSGNSDTKTKFAERRLRYIRPPRRLAGRAARAQQRKAPAFRVPTICNSTRRRPSTRSRTGRPSAEPAQRTPALVLPLSADRQERSWESAAPRFAPSIEAALTTWLRWEHGGTLPLLGRTLTQATDF
jgi:hypothetical protein